MKATLARSYHVTVAEPDRNGRCVVRLMFRSGGGDYGDHDFDGEIHRDRFDPQDNFRREQFLQSLPPDADTEQLEADLLDAYDALRDPEGGPDVVRLSTLELSRVEYLWPGRIAIGKITNIAGDPGLGKSQLLCDLAARITTGNPWPDGEPCDPGSVLMVGCEDDWADTVGPRLLAAGADLNRVHALHGWKTTDVETGKEMTVPFTLGDLTPLERAIDAIPMCRMVSIDPLSAYMAGGDSHKDADVRGLLRPLADLAMRKRIAVVGIMHLNKNAQQSPLHRAMGSLAFTAAARAVWMVVPDKDDERRRLFLCGKNNLGPTDGGLAFRVCVHEDIGQPFIEWDDGPVDVSLEEAFAKPDRRKESPASDAAESWLTGVLANGPTAASIIYDHGARVGHSPRTLRRVKTDLGIVDKRDGFGPGSNVLWMLPDHHTGHASP